MSIKQNQEILERVKKLNPAERLEWIVKEILDIKKSIEIMTKPFSERIPTDSAQRLLKLWCEKYYNHTGIKYHPSFAEDVKRMKNLIRSYGSNEHGIFEEVAGCDKVEDLINLFFRTAKDPNWYHHDKLSMAMFCSPVVLQKLIEYATGGNDVFRKDKC